MHQERMRAVIREGLQRLNDDLGDFEHTTHGVLGDGSIDAVARHLSYCYEDPSAFSVSSLSQVINQFLTRSGTADAP